MGSWLHAASVVFGSCTRGPPPRQLDILRRLQPVGLDHPSERLAALFVPAPVQ